MTEQERLVIVDKIDEDIKLVELLEQQKEKLKQLEENKIIKEYLALLNQVSILSDKTKEFKSKEDIANLEFSSVLDEEVRRKEISHCNHDIWMYYGSYGMLFNKISCIPCFIDLSIERDNDFYFNKYICLECGKEIQVNDWEEFENNHIILKNYDNTHNLEKYLKYRQQYYELLYNYSVNEANDMMVKQFYNGRRYPKKKIKK